MLVVGNVIGAGRVVHDDGLHAMHGDGEQHKRSRVDGDALLLLLGKENDGVGRLRGSGLDLEAGKGGLVVDVVDLEEALELRVDGRLRGGVRLGHPGDRQGVARRRVARELHGLDWEKGQSMG